MEEIYKIGFLGYPLLILSIIAMAIIFERIIFFTNISLFMGKKYLIQLEKLLEKNSKKDKLIREEIISFALLEIKKKFDFGLYILRFIAVISPMVGLLGTVIGIIKSFKTISALKGPVYPALIADGLWVAMLTTAIGLIIAITALIFAFLFARTTEKKIEDYQNKLNRLSFKIEGIKYD